MVTAYNPNVPGSSVPAYAQTQANSYAAQTDALARKAPATLTGLAPSQANAQAALTGATAWGRSSLGYGLGNTATASGSHGNENRDAAAPHNFQTDIRDPRFTLNTAVSGGNWNQLAAIKSYEGWKKSRSQFQALKNERGRQQLMGVAGEEGQAYGYTPPAKVKQNAAQWLAGVQGATEARNAGRVNMAYGYLPSMRGTNPYSVALNNNALITGEIGHTAGLARDASAENNTADAEANARQAAMGAASAGTVGSSMNTAAKQRVLGTFLAGRGATASATQGARLGATQGIEEERQNALAAVKGRGSIDLGQRVADITSLRQLGQAQRQVIPQAIGSGIAGLGDMYANNALYGAYARNQAGGSNGGGGMPSLSGGSSAPAGGFYGR